VSFTWTLGTPFFFLLCISVSCMQGNRNKEVIDFDPEVEGTLRKIRKKAKQKTQDHFVEEVVQNTMAAEANNPTKTLMDYTVPYLAQLAVGVV
ncbi:hypothetical protein PIB30_101962, partial [Stylosanthes scabra]|nr:hypothetical protein [Stylosanthes scabra]